MCKYLLILLFTGCAGLSRAQMQTVSFDPPWDAHYTVDDKYKNYLSNAKGRYLFILNKTAWTFFACNNPEGYLQKAKKEGITTIRVALEGNPFYEELQFDMWPWGGTRQNPDYSTLNVRYWDEVEKRVRLAGEMGFGIDLCLYLTTKLDETMIDSQYVYWKAVIDRLAKYSNIFTWEIHNEYLKNEKFQQAAAVFLKENDPLGRPVCSSDGTTDNAEWTNRDWMDLAIVHTCTGSTPTNITDLKQLNESRTSTHHLKYWYQAVARNARSHNKPAFNNESGREKRHKNDDPVHRRKQSWIFNASGCFWTHHSQDGCEDIDNMEYSSPGSEYLFSLRRFFESVPFWILAPSHTTVTAANSDLFLSSMADADRKHVVSYICTLLTGQKSSSETVDLRLPAGHYHVNIISPVTLKSLRQEQVQSKNLKHIIRISLPDFTDDILLHVTLVKEGEKSMMEGTH